MSQDLISVINRINVRWQAQQAQVDFIQAEIVGLHPNGELLINNRPPLHFDRLSLNVGAITNGRDFQQAISIKPLESSLEAITQQDQAADHRQQNPSTLLARASRY